MQNILIRTMCGWRMPKLTKISLLFCKFCTFPVTEGYTIWHSISSSQPRQESSPTEQNSSMQKDTNFGNTIILCYLGPEKWQNPTQKDTNFGNAMFLRHLGPEKCQKKTDPERHEFWQRHNSSLPWARESPNPTAKYTNFAQNCTHWPQQKCQGKYSFFQNFAHRLKCTH